MPLLNKITSKRALKEVCPSIHSRENSGVHLLSTLDIFNPMKYFDFSISTSKDMSRVGRYIHTFSIDQFFRFNALSFLLL